MHRTRPTHARLRTENRQLRRHLAAARRELACRAEPGQPELLSQPQPKSEPGLAGSEGAARDRADAEVTASDAPPARGPHLEQCEAEEALTEANRRLHQLNAAVTHSRDLLRAIFDGVHDGLALLSADGVVLACNSVLATLCDEDVERLVGRHLPQGQAMIARLIERAMAANMSVEWHDHLVGEGGRNYDVSLRPLAQSEQEPERYVLHVIDNTERAQIESLTLQNEQLSASARLAAIAAHELGTPLQAAQNCLYLLACTEDNPDLARAQAELDRMGVILQRMADIQSITDVEADGAQINNLFESLLLLTGGQLRRQRIEVELQLDATAPAVAGPKDLIMLVLLNLVLHAAEALERGGLLRIHSGVMVERQQRMLRVTLNHSGAPTHQGAPINPTGPFLSVDRASAPMRLAISRRIVEQHGGWLIVNDEQGGSRITLALPLVKVTAHSPARQQEPIV